ASGLGALDASAIARVRQEAWPVVRDADELHDALVIMGYMTEAEGERGAAHAISLQVGSEDAGNEGEIEDTDPRRTGHPDGTEAFSQATLGEALSDAAPGEASSNAPPDESSLNGWETSAITEVG